MSTLPYSVTTTATPGQIEIINVALAGLGAQPISALDDGSNEALLAGIMWDAAVTEVLRAHPWNFATRRITLSPLSTQPDHGYNAAFVLPPDCLRLLAVSADDYRLESRFLLANATTLQLEYIARIANPEEFDALFQSALSANLAMKLAYPLTQSGTQQQFQTQLYADYLRQARTCDALENPADEFEESRLLLARY